MAEIDPATPEAQRASANRAAAPEQNGAEPSGVVPVRSVVLTGIFVLLVLHTLQVARIVLLPIVIALFANLALTPVVRWLRRRRIPEPAAAVLLVLLLWGASVATVAGLSESAATWMSRLPEIADVLEERLRTLRESVKVVSAAKESVEHMTRIGDAPATPAVEVEDDGSWIALVLTSAQGVVVAWVLILTLLLFLLSSGDRFLRKLVTILPGRDARSALEALRQTEDELSTYLLTVATINAGLGVAVAVAMSVLDMPNPILWGVVAGALNFAPYLGPMVTFVVLSVVALLSFDDLARAVAVPVTFAVLTSTEGLLITPYVVGRRMLLSPVAILLTLLLWSWVWGVPGALLAVPILVATKVACERVDSLRGMARLLER